ncbi:MAG: HSP20 family protein [Candidatus Azotimanducaceae bacterium]
MLSADLHESADDLSISLKAAGLKSNDFEILIDGQTLAVRGSKLSRIKRSKGRYPMSERAFGRFDRRFALPMDVEDSETTAAYRSGVLTIHLKRSSSAKPRVDSQSLD